MTNENNDLKRAERDEAAKKSVLETMCYGCCGPRPVGPAGTLCAACVARHAAATQRLRAGRRDDLLPGGDFDQYVAECDAEDQP